jgi:hypothetical protein
MAKASSVALDCSVWIVSSRAQRITILWTFAVRRIGSLVTDRENLESAHEPNHRLVKDRTPVLLRNQGRAHTREFEAFERVRVFCTKIAEFSSLPRGGVRHHEQKTPSLEPTSTDSPAEGQTRRCSHRSGLDR